MTHHDTNPQKLAAENAALRQVLVKFAEQHGYTADPSTLSIDEQMARAEKDGNWEAYQNLAGLKQMQGIQNADQAKAQKNARADARIKLTDADGKEKTVVLSEALAEAEKYGEETGDYNRFYELSALMSGVQQRAILEADAQESGVRAVDPAEIWPEEAAKWPHLFGKTAQDDETDDSQMTEAELIADQRPPKLTLREQLAKAEREGDMDAYQNLAGQIQAEALGHSNQTTPSEPQWEIFFRDDDGNAA